MRRLLRPELPWLSHNFGITFDQHIVFMPFGEIDAYRVTNRQLTPEQFQEGWWNGGLS